MKIVHISYTDTGGAGIAMLRIHRALRDSKIDSEVIVLHKQTNTEGVREYKHFNAKILSYIIKKAERILSLLLFGFDRQLRSLCLFGVISAKYLNSLEADIIHLHWFQQSAMSLGELRHIKGKLIITTHDCWLFCGSLHYNLNSNKLAWPDRVFQNYKTKRILSSVDCITVPSDWVYNQLVRSRFNTVPSAKLFNLILEDDFGILDTKKAKDLLGIDNKKMVIGIGAVSIKEDRRKGFNKFLEAIKIFFEAKDISNYEILVFGSSNTYFKDSLFPIKYLPHIGNNKDLSVVYSAMDVFVNPTLMETFGQTTLESLVCGTPVVAFQFSGTNDIVEHNVDGYLATPYDSKDIATGIEYVINANMNGESLRSKAIKLFGHKTLTPEYISTYRTVYTIE